MKGTKHMPEETRQYQRQTPKQRKPSKKHSKTVKHSKIQKILLRQTILSLSIFAIILGIKALDPNKTNRFSKYIQNAITQPMSTEKMHPVIKNIFKASKNAFTKEGTPNESSQNRT